MITLFKKKKKRFILILMLINLPVEISLQCEVLVKALGNRVKCLPYWRDVSHVTCYGLRLFTQRVLELWIGCCFDVESSHTQIPRCVFPAPLCLSVQRKHRNNSRVIYGLGALKNTAMKMSNQNCIWKESWGWTRSLNWSWSSWMISGAMQDLPAVRAASCEHIFFCSVVYSD